MLNRASVSKFAALLLFLAGFMIHGSAQTSISGDIAGVIKDASGAVVPNATITVTSTQRGQVKTAVSGSGGEYRVSLLSPGEYRVDVAAPNFEKTSVKVTIAAATVLNADVVLQIGNQSTTVEVQADADLLHTDDAQISTNFSFEQVQSLPNPGNDLTFIAQTAPGSVMNTQGGYGNFSSFGLPATSNTFTVNGGYENDPFLNVNNSGATNLLLGNNDIASVTVVSPAYSATFGGLAGAQVAEISRSGSNTVHGDLAYFWNGSRLNANDWFNNNSGTPKSRSNANQWAASIGGPALKDKLFWFTDTEGLRVIIPVRGTLYGPTAAYQAAILNPLPVTDPLYTPYGNLAANGNSSEAPLYQTMFNYFNNAPGAASGVLDTNDTRFDVFNSTSTNFAQEWIITARADYNPTDKDKFFVHYKQDKGLQPTSTSLINPIFNANSPQPQYEGQTGWTRSIGANITNQFLITGSYYRAIFTNTNQAAATASVPLVLIPEEGDWGLNGSYIGGIDYALPQGRNVTGYQAQDDLNITKGKHSIAFGFSMRRDDVTDYTPSEHTVGEAISLDSGDLAAGYVDEWSQRYPTRLTQPLSLYTMGAYVQDQWKVMPNFTVTAGIRLEHDSNPVCHTNCFSNYADEFSKLAGLTTTPYDTIFASGRKRAFLKQQPVGVDPRIGFTFLPGGPGSKTTVRGGFGMFTDSFPAQIASSLDSNPPGVGRFLILGAYFGNAVTVDPARADSGQALAASSSQAFQANYPTGGSYASILAASGGTFRRPAYTGTNPKIHLPTTEEYSLSIERQIDAHSVVSVNYVGNHSYHGPVQNAGLNAYGTVAGLPAARPNLDLGSVATYYSANQSNYNGLLLTAARRSGWLTLQFNYSYSHALDLVSNGGFDGFGVNPVGQENPYKLSDNYGNADYNVKHYVSANYVFTLPTYKGPKALVAGWEIAGTAFHSSGLPFTVTDAGTVPTNYGSTLYADQLSGNFDHHCGGASHAGANGTPCGFGAYTTTGTGDAAVSTLSNFASATGFGSQRRNAFTGSGYTDTDLSITKSFAVPFREAKFKVGAQFYNILNHPNFAQPNADVTEGAGSFGEINSTVNTPTSVLGSFLGGDASPRLIQIIGKFSF